MNDTAAATASEKTAEKTLGQKMIDHLLAVGRKTRRAGTATTAELAEVAGVPVSQAYSRLYWLAFKQDPAVIAVVSGKGASRVWRLAPKAKPAAKPETSSSSSEPKGEKAAKEKKVASSSPLPPSSPKSRKAKPKATVEVDPSLVPPQRPSQLDTSVLPADAVS